MTMEEKTSKNFFKPILDAARRSFYLVGVFSFFINIFLLTVPIYMLQLYDRVLISQSYETLIYLTLIALIVLAVMSLLEVARSRIFVIVSTWLDKALSPEALIRIPDAVLQGKNYTSQAMRDVTQIRQFIASPAIFTLFDSPWVPIYIIVIFLIHPYLGLVATGGAVILFVLALLNEMATKKPLLEANRQSISLNQFVDSSMRNAEVIQATGMMPSIVKRWLHNNNPILALQTIASNRAGAILAISKFMRLALQVLMLGIGAWLVINYQVTAGGMIAGSILLARALAPVEQAIGVWKQMLSAREAYFRLENHFAQDPSRVSEITLPHPKGHVTINNLVYRPPGLEKPVLMGITLDIPAGQFVGLIGPSGAGKSTLARLILGAIPPTAGDVRLDDANVYQWGRESFGQYVGYLPQDIELFNGTVKDNIASLGEVEDEEVIKAAQLAQVHEMILHMPQGYETQITPFSLSGGQRQRVALARAFYKNPRLVILDEPNSNLDRDGDVALINALLQHAESKVTRIVISHKPSIIKHVDRLIVLNQGRVQLDGSVNEVLSKLSAQNMQQGDEQHHD